MQGYDDCEEAEAVKPRHYLSLVALVGAIIVASTGNDGWGWLLVFSFLAGVPHTSY